jgi:hypothetical protein
MSYKIPTREEHRAFIRRIWMLCIGSAIGIFVVVGGLMTVLFLKGYDSKKIVEVSTTAFQVLVLSYGMGFFVPAFLTSLFNMALGVEMSRAGLEIGQDTAKILEKVDNAIEGRLTRLDGLFDKIDRASDLAEQGQHPVLKQLTLDIRKAGDTIRDEVAELRKAFTKPIVAPIRKIEAPSAGVLESVNSEKRNGS